MVDYTIVHNNLDFQYKVVECDNESSVAFGSGETIVEAIETADSLFDEGDVLHISERFAEILLEEEIDSYDDLLKVVENASIDIEGIGMLDNFVNFRCTYGTASFSGFVCIDDFDDDCPFRYIGHDGQTYENIGNADWEGTKEDIEILLEAFNNDDMVLQFLYDYRHESTKVYRDNMIILINGDDDG